jgi:hypothetical protein
MLISGQMLTNPKLPLLESIGLVASSAFVCVFIHWRPRLIASRAPFPKAACASMITRNCIFVPQGLSSNHANPRQVG